MKIYLMRHAEALNPEADIRRPLSETGRVNATKIADYLKNISTHLTTIYHSDTLRAAQTAEILTNALMPIEGMQVMNNLNSPDAATDIANTIQYRNDDILLVGHIPLLPRLLSKLIIQNENLWIFNFQFPGSIVCLENLSNKGCTISWVIYPDILQK